MMEAIQIIKYEKTRKETKQNKQQCIDKVVWSSDKLNWSMLREISSSDAFRIDRRKGIGANGWCRAESAEEIQEAPVKPTVQKEGISASTILLLREHVRARRAQASAPVEPMVVATSGAGVSEQPTDSFQPVCDRLN